MKKIFLAFILSTFMFGAVASWYAISFLSSPISKSGEEVILDVIPGDTYHSALRKLEEKGLLERSLAFKVYTKIYARVSPLKIGEYQISGAMNPRELFEKLSSGESIYYAVTFPEGTNMYEIAEMLESKGLVSKEKFIELCKNQGFIKSLLGEEVYSLEGYLFPETYQITKFTGEKSIIREMVRNFLKNFNMVTNKEVKSFTRHQAVILASMIEKETGAGFERPVISSVFHNRLKKKMRLESDPTILYGILDITGKMKKNITRKDIRTKTRYNTYRVNGIPFGPIANPGKDSLQAVFNPKSTDYFFFVSQNDGTHYFSKTYKEHLRAVKKYQLDRKMREGRSWRDLKQ